MSEGASTGDLILMSEGASTGDLILMSEGVSTGDHCNSIIFNSSKDKIK